MKSPNGYDLHNVAYRSMVEGKSSPEFNKSKEDALISKHFPMIYHGRQATCPSRSNKTSDFNQSEVLKNIF